VVERAALNSELIRAEELRKAFRGVQAVAGLSLRVAEGEMLGIIGPNGAGKTTVFNLIAGTFRPDSGRILYADRDITRLPPHRRLRMGIARTFQLVQPFPSLTVRQSLLVSATGSGAGAREASIRADEAIEQFHLSHAASRPSLSVNAVEGKRLEVARAVAARPRVLLLDEIFTGLNSDEVEELAAMLRHLRENGVTVLLIEHNVTAIRLVAERVIAMDSGHQVSEGTPDAVFADAAVVESYLGRRASA
jgi:branched-chain amino acid transport system ATP-binding protein